MALTETILVDLAAGPVELDAVTEIAAAKAAAEVNLYIQNVGRGKVYTAQRTTAPARTDKGHCLSPGDAIFYVTDATALWLWAASTGSVAVSSGE